MLQKNGNLKYRPIASLCTLYKIITVCTIENKIYDYWGSYNLIATVQAERLQENGVQGATDSGWNSDEIDI